MRCLLLFAFSVACGGRVAGSVDGADGGTAVADWCTSGGARVCGGTCGATVDCAGGCAPLVEGDGTTSTFGVCFSDLSDKGNTSCALCDTGQGCVQRESGEFVCVPLTVCESLRNLGSTDVCWFGDKTPYDGTTVPDAQGCPSGALSDSICGGDCGSCNTSTSLDRCIGQGPTHPFGTCAVFESPGNSADPSSFPLCALGSAGYLRACPPSTTEYQYACAIDPSPPADSAIATQNGFCLNVERCKNDSTTLPGGLRCYDSAANLISP